MPCQPWCQPAENASRMLLAGQNINEYRMCRARTCRLPFANGCHSGAPAGKRLPRLQEKCKEWDVMQHGFLSLATARMRTPSPSSFLVVPGSSMPPGCHCSEPPDVRALCQTNVYVHLATITSLKTQPGMSMSLWHPVAFAWTCTRWVGQMPIHKRFPVWSKHTVLISWYPFFQGVTHNAHI